MLLAVMPVDTVTGVVLMLAPPGFPGYLAAGRTWGPSPLADLHDGGIIMWAGGDSIMTVLAVAPVRDVHP
jgi:putative copper resistance protein D